MGKEDSKINQKRQFVGLLLYITLFVTSFTAVSFFVSSTILHADDHKSGGVRHKQEHGNDREYGRNSHATQENIGTNNNGDEHGDEEEDDDNGGQERGESNEATGLATAVLLVFANITVVLSLMIKLILNILPKNSTTRSFLVQLNGMQKKRLRALHYWLNPIVLVLAFIHLFLSSCDSTILPECGLALMAILTLSGLMLKQRFLSNTIRKHIRIIHTYPIGIILMVMILIFGHTIID